MILYAAYKCIKDNKSFDSLKTAIVEFTANYEVNEGYKQFTQSGTSNSDMVRGRFDYWRNLLREI